MIGMKHCCNNSPTYYDYSRLQSPCMPDMKEKCGVVFDNILIPANLGGSKPDDPYAPKNGAYTNALVQYELDGGTFIYDSNGIFFPIANAVLSVNGKTGEVSLKASDLENDAKYQTEEEVKELVNAVAVGTTNTYPVATSDWGYSVLIAPFKYTATVDANYEITDNTVAELYNDNAIAFASYGLALGKAEEGKLTFYAMAEPTENLQLKVNFRELE